MSVGICKCSVGFIKLGRDLYMSVEIYKCSMGFINVSEGFINVMGDSQMWTTIAQMSWL